MIPDVDTYLIDGCGRCKLFATPECKVNPWRDLLTELRALILETGLTEEIKWGVPCYTDKGKNILIISAFKDYCCVSFFKGTLLKDEPNLLVKQGENVQAARLFKIRSNEDLERLRPYIKPYVFEAIEIERSGKEVKKKKTSDYNVPEELIAEFKNDHNFKEAFESLTPGRQKGYLLYFSSAKQAKTRTDRILKYKDKIFDGKGFHD